MVRALLLALPLASGLLLAPPALRRPGRASVSMQFPSPPDLSDEKMFPKGPDGKVLITRLSLDKTGLEMIDMALQQRNKVRVMEGKPKYEDVDAMIDAYVEYEGEAKGLSRAQCEDEVLRFLQKTALLMEGGADMKDPQTIVTFGLLGALVFGAAYNYISNGGSFG